MIRNVNEAFGQRVRVAMAAARVTRKAVAENCGVSVQAVQRWCDGSAMPSSSNMMVLTRMTGASIEWLMWPHSVDICSTDWAPNGIHLKNTVRQVLAEIAGEQASQRRAKE